MPEHRPTPPPVDDADFDRQYPDEAAAEAFFHHLRWPDGVVCPDCGSRAMSWLETRNLWECSPCEKQTSLRSGTVLHRTRKPLLDWLRVLWKCSVPPTTSTRALAIEMGYRYATLFDMVHKLRVALAERGIWQLTGTVFVGTVELPVPKRAAGDKLPRPRRPRAVVAVARRHRPTAEVPDLVRMEVAPPDALADAEVLALTLHRHVAPEATPWMEPGRLGPPTVLRHALPFVETHSRIGSWLTETFGGVSRRYLANYLAQWSYLANRSRRSADLFSWVGRRLVSEPWRPRSDMVLAAP